MKTNTQRRRVIAHKMDKPSSLPDHRFIIGMCLNALLSKDETTIDQSVKACREYLRETKNVG